MERDKLTGMPMTVECQECRDKAAFIQVGQTGNFVTKEDMRFVGFWCCYHCKIVISVECDQVWGEWKWNAQSAEDKRLRLPFRNRIDEYLFKNPHAESGDVNRRKNRNRGKRGK